MSQAEPEVLVRREGRAGRLTLNRPRALHALNLSMCEALGEALLAWRTEPEVELVILDHAGGRGFCAGGDIRAAAESGAGDGRLARDFFHAEYRLNHLLFVYPKPVVAIMDGVTMGGGVGLAAPARLRIATERTLFAMPEAAIGLFPDVGGGWYLPRLPGRTGLWLALTGARLKAADCKALGLATHVVASERLPELKVALAAEPSAAAQTLAAFETDPGAAPLAAHRAQIDRLFGGDSVEAIFEALEADGSEWAREQLEALRSKSPQTLKVAHRQLSLGAQTPSFADEIRLEYGLAVRITRRHDFQEGVRAVLIEKDNAPRWRPASLEEVTPQMLDEIFAPLPPEEAWTPFPQLSTETA